MFTYLLIMEFLQWGCLHEIPKSIASCASNSNERRFSVNMVLQLNPLNGQKENKTENITRGIFLNWGARYISLFTRPIWLTKTYLIITLCMRAILHVRTSRQEQLEIVLMECFVVEFPLESVLQDNVVVDRLVDRA